VKCVITKGLMYLVAFYHTFIYLACSRLCSCMHFLVSSGLVSGPDSGWISSNVHMNVLVRACLALTKTREMMSSDGSRNSVMCGVS